VKRYAIGLDFGTLSGRAVLVDVETGALAATHATRYSNGIIDEALPAAAARGWAMPGRFRTRQITFR